MIIITYHETEQLNPSETRDLVLECLDLDKAENVICIDLSNDSALADYMVIATGTSSRHVNGLVRKLKEKLQLKGIKGITTEGLAQSDWVVMDAGDVIIHVFRPEVREFYNIEKMWCSQPHLDVVGNDQIQA